MFNNKARRLDRLEAQLAEQVKADPFGLQTPCQRLARLAELVREVCLRDYGKIPDARKPLQERIERIIAAKDDNAADALLTHFFIARVIDDAAAWQAAGRTLPVYETSLLAVARDETAPLDKRESSARWVNRALPTSEPVVAPV